MRRLFLLAVAVTIVVPLLLVVVVTMAALATADCGDGTPTAVTVPSGSVQTMGEMVGYLESQSIPAIDAAGIVGNLMQESGLNPMEHGYGLAEWSPGWWASASAWIAAQGQNPNSAGGQLMYIAANVNQGVDGARFYAGLRSDLHRATSAQEAALVWMNDYEQCSGAGPRGSESFTPGSLCMAGRRESYAVQALRAAARSQASGEGELLLSSAPDGSCNSSFPLTGSIRGYTNPLQGATGIVWERTDQGVDAAMAPGSPLLAFAPSIVRMIVGELLRGSAGDRVRGDRGAAGGQMVVSVRADHAEGQPRADDRRRPDRRDVRVGRHGDRDRLVDAPGWLPTRTPRLQGRAGDQRGRRLSLPAAGARCQPGHRRGPLHRSHDRQRRLPDRQSRAVGA